MGDGTLVRERPAPVRLPGSWSELDDACGIRTDGTAWCWGSSGLGPVADGTTDLRTTPVQVP